MEQGDVHLASVVTRYAKATPFPMRIAEMGFPTEKGRYYDLTPIVQEHVSCAGVSMGICLVNTRHTSAGLWLNERGEGIPLDLEATLDRFASESATYQHDLQMHRSQGISMDTEPRNGYSHQRSLLFPSDISIPIIAGKLALGTYQSIMFVELDGPRETRQVTVSCMGHPAVIPYLPPV